MAKLIAFEHLTLDGYFTDAKGDMTFAHRQSPDAEWDAFAESNARRGSRLVFGRITYELMASFWPTPSAKATMPSMAERMNSLPKVVFSRTMKDAPWENTRLVKGDLAGEVRRMKGGAGGDIVILGSGTIVKQLTDARLIDEYQLVVNPVALGAGRTLFEGIEERLALELTSTRAFGNGNVVLGYGVTS